jgi:hypothetical protein
MLKTTTELLNDLGCLRYFGDMDRAKSGTLKSRSDHILHDSVFINIAWTMGVVRSVISHDRCCAACSPPTSPAVSSFRVIMPRRLSSNSLPTVRKVVRTRLVAISFGHMPSKIKQNTQAAFYLPSIAFKAHVYVLFDQETAHHHVWSIDRLLLTVVAMPCSHVD